MLKLVAEIRFPFGCLGFCIDKKMCKKELVDKENGDYFIPDRSFEKGCEGFVG